LAVLKAPAGVFLFVLRRKSRKGGNGSEEDGQQGRKEMVEAPGNGVDIAVDSCVGVGGWMH